MKIPPFPRVFLPASPPVLYLFVLVFALNYGIIIKKFVVFATPPVHFRFLVSVAYLLLMVWRFSVLLALFSFYYDPPLLFWFSRLSPPPSTYGLCCNTRKTLSLNNFFSLGEPIIVLYKTLLVQTVFTNCFLDVFFPQPFFPSSSFSQHPPSSLL